MQHKDISNLYAPVEGELIGLLLAHIVILDDGAMMEVQGGPQTVLLDAAVRAPMFATEAIVLIQATVHLQSIFFFSILT
jgi:hypothetical protein